MVEISLWKKYNHVSFCRARSSEPFEYDFGINMLEYITQKRYFDILDYKLSFNN